MEFGRVDNLESIHFGLPKDHNSITKILSTGVSKKIQVYCGCPIWTEKGWVGSIYPSKAKPGDYLKYYAQQFNSIELNGTHYQIPDTTTLNKWKAMAGDGFQFCPKVQQMISHAKDLSKMKIEFNAFLNTMQHLEMHLGPIFLQVSPNFTDKQLLQLTELLDHKNSAIELAIELRHASWFDQSQAFNDLCNYLYKHQIHMVITDTAGRRDVIHQRLTTKTAFIRFTANDLHASDFQRLDEWIIRVNDWINLGLEKLYFFMHTPTKSLTTQLAQYFIEGLNAKASLDLKAPKFIGSQNKLL
jgi:uncharacterized protein YecE (DUF72 family)